jgi:hypothetical protein
MRRYFAYERSKSGADRQAIDRLEVAALAAAHQENEAGGQARQVVADVARVLGVDIDEGPGHRWDPEHMGRVVAGAADICEERDDLRELVAQLAEQRDLMTAQRDEAVRKAATSDARRPIRMEVPAELFRVPDDDELKATIVRQAREITRLTGESE